MVEGDFSKSNNIKQSNNYSNNKNFVPRYNSHIENNFKNDFVNKLTNEKEFEIKKSGDMNDKGKS